ncbi:MAG: hypothetical protein PWP03_392 [Candidatus Woesearchaeota archaeon]|nr:hypothetical protein [Candidatus Woesearchaeota archaeon]MDN5327754.1 hypothetical protein [Candidatus Woesearchaeota archaeon]
MKRNSILWIVLAVILLLVSSCVPQNQTIDQQIIDNILKQIEELNLTKTNESAIFKEITAEEGDEIKLIPILEPLDEKVKYYFSAPFNQNGTWKTKKDDAGIYLVKVTIEKNNKNITKNIKLIVKPKNYKPEIVVNDTIFAKENTTLRLNFTVYDKDNDSLKINISGWLNSTTKYLDFNSQGEHFAKITVSDGKTRVSKTVKIIVENVNRKPIINITSKKVKLNTKVTFSENEIFDPDGDKITIKPEQIIFTQKGNFSKLITVCDQYDCVNKTILFEVEEKNLPPKIIGPSTINVSEGQTFCLPLSFKDPENDSLTIVYSGWMTEACKKVGYNESGTHIVNIIVSDGINQVQKQIKVFVKNVNRFPIIKDIIAIKE